MELFRKKTNTYNSESLRESLFTAICQGDTAKLVDLCNKQASLIIQYFADWRQIPSNLRKDPEAVKMWIDCLISVANALKSIGHPELYVSLTEDNNNI
jgi:hypothetical protein